MADVFVRSIDGLNIDDVWDELSESRKQKIKRLKNKKQALLSAAAELALNRAVKTWFPEALVPVSYLYTERGKPYLTGLDAYISLSHSGKLAVCAISGVPVGVDIQQLRNTDIKIAERFFSEEEKAAVAAACGKEREKIFFEIWVKKEAYVKLTGEGISAGFGTMNDKKKGEYIYNTRFLAEENSMLCVCERKIYKNSLNIY